MGILIDTSVLVAMERRELAPEDVSETAAER